MAADRGVMQVQWPRELAMKFGAHGYKGECLGAWQVIAPHALIGIVDTVRNRILDFALKIEAENPNAGEALPNDQPVPADRVQMIFQNVIYFMGLLQTLPRTARTSDRLNNLFHGCPS